MADVNRYEFSFKDVVEALIKQQGLHEGIWGFTAKYGFNPVVAGSSPEKLQPMIVIPLQKVGLMRVDEESNIAVDAAKVNPPSSPTKRLKHKK